MTRRRLLAGLGALVALLALPFAWLRPKPKRVLRAEARYLRDPYGGVHRVELVPARTYNLDLLRGVVRHDRCEQRGHDLYGKDCWRWEAAVDMRGIPEGPELVTVVQWGDGRTEVWPNHIRGACRQVTYVDWIAYGAQAPARVHLYRLLPARDFAA